MKERQEDDFYATEPKATEVLMDVEEFNKNIWECACGQGHISEQLIKRGYKVKSTDLIYRGYGTGGVNFFNQTGDWNGDIVTNPPYKYATDWVYKSLELLQEGNKLALFLKLQFQEGKARKKLFLKHPPKYIYVSSSRLLCAKNADFEGMRAGGGSAVAYGWYIWYKGSKSETIIRWVN